MLGMEYRFFKNVALWIALAGNSLKITEKKAIKNLAMTIGLPVT
jgi:hypothetical protein